MLCLHVFCFLKDTATTEIYTYGHPLSLTRLSSVLLGVGGHAFRSPPMLVIPIEWSGGVARSLERRTGWQEAWARFRTGSSSIDYVRPTGTGSDPLLLNLGQIGRRDRGWWRMVLDQFGASDVLIPVARLYRQYPGD